MSTHPKPASAPGAKADNTRWTGAKASAFLKHLARCGKVAEAARAVGMSRQAAYRLRDRAPLFAHYWDDALELARRRRAKARKGRRAIHPLLARSPLAPDARPAPGPGNTAGRAASHAGRRTVTEAAHAG